MKIITIAINDLKIIMKDKKALLILLLMPFILISILGTVFKSVGTTGISAFNIAVYSEDEGFLDDDSLINLVEGVEFNGVGDILINEVLKGEELRDMLIVEEVSSYNEGKESVEKGRTEAFIYIPEKFTQNYILNRGVQIEVIGNPTKIYTPQIVKDIVESFTDRLNGISFALNKLGNLVLDREVGIRFEELNISELMNEIANVPDINIIEEGVNESNSVSGIAYYGIAMAIMFALFSGQEGAIRVLDEKRNMTAFRIFTTPISFWEYLIGKLIGIIALIFTQMMVLIICSSIVFGVDWGNIMGIILMTISVGICIGPIALMVGSSVASSQSALRIYNLCIWVFSLLGGAFMPIDVMPETLQTLSKFTPNGQALTGYLKIIRGAGISEWIGHAGVLVGLGLAFLFLAIIINKKEGSVQI